MAQRFFMGKKPGVGPVLKVMADTSYDPLTTPNTDYHKFFFNSETDSFVNKGDIGSFQTSTSGFVWPTYPNGPNNYSFLSGAVTATLSTYNSGNKVLQWTMYPNLLMDDTLSGVVTFEDAVDAYRSVYSYYAYSEYPNHYIGVRKGALSWTRQGGVETYGFLGGTAYFNNESAATPYGAVALQSTSETTLRAYQPFVQWKQFGISPFSALSFASATPSSGQKILKIDKATGTAKMARPGYDVDTATDAQLIFGGATVPLRVIKAGSVTIASGAVSTITLPVAPGSEAYVDYQVNIPGEPVLLPVAKQSAPTTMGVSYKIVGSTLYIKNDGAVSVQVRYIVTAANGSSQSSGSAKVLEKLADGIVIRRPLTAGNQQADVLFDSRCATLPLVTQGTIAAASLVNSNNTWLGAKMAQVSFTNPGFVPYVRAFIKREKKTDSNTWCWYEPLAVQDPGNNAVFDHSFIVKVENTLVTFYCGGGDNSVLDTNASGYIIGRASTFKPSQIRYFIFALPSTV